MRTVVIGSGSWGTALAQVLQDNHQEVLVYGVAEAEVNDINENHKNSKYFGDVELNPELLHFSYSRYIENKLREAFGFTGTPIKILARKRS